MIMEKETPKTEEEIVEEFYKQYKPARIGHRTETNPIIEAYFAKQFEEAQALAAKIKFPPDWENW
jgi:hypothetical protein